MVDRNTCFTEKFEKLILLRKWFICRQFVSFFFRLSIAVFYLRNLFTLHHNPWLPAKNDYFRITWNVFFFLLLKEHSARADADVKFNLLSLCLVGSSTKKENCCSEWKNEKERDSGIQLVSQVYKTIGLQSHPIVSVTLFVRHPRNGFITKCFGRLTRKKERARCQTINQFKCCVCNVLWIKSVKWNEF